MPGFCPGCPIPKIISSIESGEADFCKVGLLSQEDVRQATAALLRAIAAKGNCEPGEPRVAFYSEVEDWTSCQNEYVSEINGIGDALETENAGIILTAQVVEAEIVDERKGN